MGIKFNLIDIKQLMCIQTQRESIRYRSRAFIKSLQLPHHQRLRIKFDTWMRLQKRKWDFFELSTETYTGSKM